jgi:hypothetical protein
MKASLIKVSQAAQDALDAGALDNGVLRVMPAAFYQQFEQVEVSGFCLRNGLYCLPTVELVDKINELIQEVSPTRSAIEIGSGNGVLGKALGIPCTDSHMQEDPAVIALYRTMGQPVITYGPHVERLDAEAAVARHRPEVVVAAWVTHKYNPAEHGRGGNVYGVDEIALLGRIKRYIFVGNFYTHEHKPLLNLSYTVHDSAALFSRAQQPQGNGVVVWDNPDFKP